MCAWLGSRHKFLHVCGRGHSSGAPGKVKVDQCKVMGGGWPGVPPVQNGRINLHTFVMPPALLHLLYE